MIEVEQLGKSYTVPVRDGGLRAAVGSVFRRRTRTVEAVHDMSFRIAAGEVVGFLGPNGAGKTTTLKMLAGLLHPSTGTATVDGFVPWRRDRAYLQRMALVMGQRSQLQWDLPVVDSYRLNATIFQIADPVLRRRLDELTDLLELGDLLHKPARNLSLGERMKCEFAGSLLHQPRVLFLDEPTIGLDVAMQRRIRSFVAEYNRRTGAVVLLTSHYMADVEALCERVVVIHHGRLRYDGGLAELVRRFSADKTVAVELADHADPTPEQLRDVLGAVPYERTATGLVVHVPVAEAPQVTARLLSQLPVADLTIEDPAIETVIEKVFSVDEPGPGADAAVRSS